jgi:adenine phosphoribosyltransferase
MVQLKLAAAIREKVRDVPDFPKPGIIFKDITPLLADVDLFPKVSAAMAEPFSGAAVTHVAAIESRGFILGAPVAQLLRAAFVPVRKKGKLPSRTESVEYALEYGTDTLEMHADSCGPGHIVLVVDDVLATGGTAAATCELLEKMGASVAGCSFLMELSFLAGAARLKGRESRALVTY